MEVFKVLLIVGTLLTSLASHGASITVLNDSDILSSAEWIQLDGSWFVEDSSSYSMIKDNFISIGDGALNSLLVPFDDALFIYNGDDVIFDSLAEGMAPAWTQIIDVFSYLDNTIYISDTDNVFFTVVNRADYAKSVVWNRSVEVPDPSVFLIFGLALIAFGLKRRQSSGL